MRTVLIIDDEEDLCALLKTVLVRENFSVDCSYTLANAGMKLLNPPDVILLDINLPDGSGLDYFHLNPGNFKKSSVVFISADLTPGIDERVDLSGVAAFIRKPFTIGILLETIKKLA